MHIVYLHPQPVPDTRPECMQILYTVDALGEIGTEVTLVTPEPRKAVPDILGDILGRELSGRVRLHYLPDPRRRWWFPLASSRPFYAMARLALAGLDADAVLVRNLKLAEHLLKAGLERPIFFEAHELFAQSYREAHPEGGFRVQRKLAALARRERLVYRHAAGLFTLTQALADDIRSRYAVETPYRVVPDGVDLRQAQPLRPSPATSRPVLLYLGSLHPWKGVEVLIDAMRWVEHAELRIVGGSEQRRRELTAHCTARGVSDRVVLVGPVAPAQRFNVIAGADICLLPLTLTSIASRYTSPLKLFEYMAAGKAIVTSDLPSVREVIEPGVHALTAQPEDAQSFAQAMRRLLLDAELRARLGAAARDRAEAFTWTKRASQIVYLIASVKSVNREAVTG